MSDPIAALVDVTVPSRLAGVSLEVAAGEVVALCGGTGGGKTSTLEVVTGSLAASKGRVAVPPADTVGVVMLAVDDPASRPVAGTVDPAALDLLVADEPTELVDGVFDQVADLFDECGTGLVATHDRHVERWADRCVVARDGRLSAPRPGWAAGRAFGEGLYRACHDRFESVTPVGRSTVQVVAPDGRVWELRFRPPRCWPGSVPVATPDGPAVVTSLYARTGLRVWPGRVRPVVIPVEVWHRCLAGWSRFDGEQGWAELLAGRPVEVGG